MAVTDLTDSLPYWARQGSGAPGATGGPEGAPQGGPGSPAWLQYLSQYYGISPAQAMAMLNGGGGPSPDGNPHGDGPAAPPAPVVAPPRPVQAAQTQPPPSVPQSTGDEFPGPQLRPPGITQPTGVSTTGLPLQPGSLSPGALAQFGSAAGGPIGSGGYVPTPSGGGSTSPTAPVAAPGPVAGPLAGGGAAGTAATSNPRFIGIDAPNATAQNSMLSRGVPQGTALNLAGLFGGGGQNPNVPAANAQPVSGPLAQGGMSNAPWNMGPQQLRMSPSMYKDWIAAQSLKQRYG